MNLKLVKPCIKYKKEYIEMIEEWKSAEEKIVPASIRKDYSNFNKMIKEFQNEEKGLVKEGVIPSTTYWGYDEETGKIVGAVNIRHYLNKAFMKNGGNIGDGIRPSERRKGYATKMINLALEKCKNLGIEKVLMVCYKDNVGSVKSIKNNGGILENEIPANNGKIDQRYWINIRKE